ncbi:MAG: 4Fe-4S dicluster domain-containing protein [Pirellulales bacterium]|nr:4Fe-4S dicluster domain-containing protein [Pirellulales bacterium]
MKESTMRETENIKVLIAGAGPAGLACAIRLKRKLNSLARNESVVVIDKASKLGYHNLSGAVFETACLDELIPGWQEENNSILSQMVKIEKDELYHLTSKHAIRFPSFLVPKSMRHQGDYSISASKLVAWLGAVAEKEGVEIYPGYAGNRLVMDQGRVRGVKLADSGRNSDGKPKENYLEGETIHAPITVLSDGSRGVLSRQFTDMFPNGSNPQVYSVGVKQLVQLPKNNPFGNDRAVHTLGYPLKSDVFGGGFLYSMGNDLVAVGMILGLDWKYKDLNPQGELEVFKSHPFIASLLDGGTVLSAGVKTIPEGGFYSLPRLFQDGAVLIGDAAGFVNMEKIKGLHNAVRSGIASADAIFEAILEDDFSAETLQKYSQNLAANRVMKEMYHARNFRQVFRWGTYLGAPLSRIQHLLPFKLGLEQDFVSTKDRAELKRNYEGMMDKATFTGLSGTTHREDEPSHIRIRDPKICKKCIGRYDTPPCVHLCPGQVYRVKDEQIILSASNCMHDGSCVVKCPYQNISWEVPESGEGPQYKQM